METVSRSRGSLILLAHLAAVAVIGVGDYLSGPDFELRPLYLLAVLSAAWFGGRWIGVSVSLAATVALFLANDFIGAALTKGVAIPLYNSLSRLTTYVVVTLLVAYIRRQASALGARTEELRREAELREESIGFFVHELRHSAAAVSLAVASLASSKVLMPEDRSYLERLRAQASELEQVARQLLTIGPLEHARPTLDRRELDLRDIAGAVVAASPHADRIDLRVPADPARVQADEDRIRSAVANLVRNALQYSPASARVGVAVFEQDGHVGLDVTDAGVGIRAQDIPLLFRKYGRLGRDGDDRTGLGLGLYLTRLIVEAHGGTVSASSRGVGQGAAFRILLPRA